MMLSLAEFVKDKTQAVCDENLRHSLQKVEEDITENFTGYAIVIAREDGKFSISLRNEPPHWTNVTIFYEPWNTFLYDDAVQMVAKINTLVESRRPGAVADGTFFSESKYIPKYGIRDALSEMGLLRD